MQVKCLFLFRAEIRCYWVVGIRYWCLSEIGVNFIYLRIAKYKIGKNSPLPETDTQPGQAGIEFDSIGI
jgi:hypothetical protein